MTKPPPAQRTEVFERSLKLERLQKGPNGRFCCRFCGTEVPKGRQTFCSDKCVQEWLIRASPDHARHLLRERDQGLCADCGLDCEAITQQIQGRLRRARLASTPLCQAQVYDRKLRRYRHRTEEERAGAEGAFRAALEAFNELADSLRAVGFTIYRSIPLPGPGESLFQVAYKVNQMPRPRSAWEADHIIPICEGGGACGLDNLRTVCWPCHRKRTGELARRRSKK